MLLYNRNHCRYVECVQLFDFRFSAVPNQIKNCLHRPFFGWYFLQFYFMKRMYTNSRKDMHGESKIERVCEWVRMACGHYFSSRGRSKWYDFAFVKHLKMWLSSHQPDSNISKIYLISQHFCTKMKHTHSTLPNNTHHEHWIRKDVSKHFHQKIAISEEILKMGLIPNHTYLPKIGLFMKWLMSLWARKFSFFFVHQSTIVWA